jgi:signal transduction histidine kinase
MHLAMVLCLDPGQLVAAVALSRGLAMFVAQRQIWYRALFNVGTVLGATLAASYVFRIVLGNTDLAGSSGRAFEVAATFAAAALIYYAICAASASGILAFLTRDSVWRAWRENFGYGAELAGTAGLILLAPVMALCFQGLGWFGLIVFLAPMVLVRYTSVQYIALRQSQGTLIAAERLAAKGEIAAEVGHDIKNFLHGISAQLYSLQMKGATMEAEEIERRVQVALEQLKTANTLSDGLMAFTCRDSKLQASRIADLITETTRFLTPQKRFDGVRLELDLDPRVAEVTVDPNQIQQMVMNLMINAANAMYEANSARKNLWVTLRLHETSDQVELMVADSGPGVAPDLRDRILEPGFTTRQAGHGFGLSTVHRVVQNHAGTIRVEENPGGGALFRVFLPRTSRIAEPRRAA